jgi:hypothetical protein
MRDYGRLATDECFCDEVPQQCRANVPCSNASLSAAAAIDPEPGHAPAAVGQRAMWRSFDGPSYGWQQR